MEAKQVAVQSGEGLKLTVEYSLLPGTPADNSNIAWLLVEGLQFDH